jgi:hypothetical protein
VATAWGRPQRRRKIDRRGVEPKEYLAAQFIWVGQGDRDSRFHRGCASWATSISLALSFLIFLCCPRMQLIASSHAFVGDALIPPLQSINYK